jgi:hypothetical protein
MNKRGFALIAGLMVITVLFILGGSLFLKTANENNLTRRYVNSMKALWVAEAGVAEAIANLPSSPTDGSLDGYTYQTTTTYRATIDNSDYYDVASTGIVPFSSGGDTRRVVGVVVKRGPVDASKFKYGIDAANDLCFGSPVNCNKDAEEFLDPDICDGQSCAKEFDSNINFSDLFGQPQSAVEAIATHYTESTFPGAVSGVTWVDVTPGQTLMVAGGDTGTGILIVEGDVEFAGAYQFQGIIYVLGNLTARGTFDAYGSTIVASSVGADSINGTPEFHYDAGVIEDALETLSNNFKSIVSWKED